MTLLILGLVIFLGVHSLRIVSEDLRTQLRTKLGEGPFKGLYSVLSIAGFVAIVYGYAQARLDPTLLWATPVWTRHLASLLTLPAFVLLVAAYVPGNAFKARLHHPMVLGVKLWALAHLVANNTLADLLLFGGFLLWAVFSFRAARARPRGPRRLRAGPRRADRGGGGRRPRGLGGLRLLGARGLDRRAAFRLIR